MDEGLLIAHGHSLGDMMLSKDIASKYTSLCGFCDIIDAGWQYGIAVVGDAICCQKANQALYKT